jgi:glycosyltransferase involved in cell wall biosynthesis
MSSIKFSVVIPTRERAATLRHCLRTCLDQNYDDYEVIVSDNNSSPDTRAVVDEAASSRVRYFRTRESLSLASSWDFAVSHARGEYVLVIGDDDGLLPHGLVELDRITRESKQKVVRWDPAFYTWPNYALAGEGNYLRIPLYVIQKEIDGHQAIQDVISFQQPYSTLPMIYNSAVHKDILAAIRTKTGRVFANRIADVYSGFCIAHVARRFLSLDLPISISGQSSASTGVAFFFFRDRSAIDREFRQLNARENLQDDPRVPDVTIFPHTAVADAFLTARRLLFPTDAGLVLDQKLFVKQCIEGLRAESEEEWRKALGLLRQALAHEPDGFAWFDSAIASLRFEPARPVRMRPERLGFDGRYLHLDAAGFGVADINGAAALCERVLNYRQCGVRHCSVPNTEEMQAYLMQVCDERLALIQKLSSQITELQRRSTIGQWMRSVARRLKGLVKPFHSASVSGR